MTHTTEPNLDELEVIMRVINDYASGWDVGCPEPSEDDIKQAIQALISDQVAKARLTQLERLYKNGTITKQAWDYESAILEDNIATINGVKK